MDCLIQTVFPKVYFRILYVSILLVLFLQTRGKAQLAGYELSRLDIEMQDTGGQAMPFPFTGGLAMPHFGNIDLDQDGVQDIIVFDRIGSQVLPFLLQSNQPDNPYHFAPAYKTQFPPLANFAAFRDFNCDGKADIFTSVTGSIASSVFLQIYESAFDGGEWTFTERPYRLIGSLEEQIKLHALDIPAITDVNFDGDLDLLYFPPDDNFVFYYENRSIELGYGCDSLIFELVDACWGLFEYSLNGLELNVCPGRSGKKEKRDHDHEYGNILGGCTGAVTAAFDYQGDTDKDLLFSGIADEALTLLINDGDMQGAGVDSFRYGYTRDPVVLLAPFPAPFFVDLDADQDQDLVVSSNQFAAVMSSSAGEEIFHFENIGDTLTPVWSHQNDHFILDQTIDHGVRSAPVVADFDGDGLEDLLIAANRSDSVYTFLTYFHLYKNIGTADAPAYQLVDSDYGQLSRFRLRSARPAVGDLDRDGDLDLVVGDFSGKLTFLENIGITFTVYQKDAAAFKDIRLGSYVSPTLVDLNEDGWLDVVAGTANGPLSYLENPADGNMVFEITDNDLADFSLIPNTQSAPFFIPGSDSTQSLMLIANNKGKVNLYEYERVADSTHFKLLETAVPGISVGNAATLCVADLNSDGELELLMGNERGGLEVFSPNQEIISAYHELSTANNALRIFPNPARSQLTIEVDCFENDSNLHFRVFDTAGKAVLDQAVQMFNNRAVIDVSQWPDGLYFCQLINKEISTTQKSCPTMGSRIVIQR